MTRPAGLIEPYLRAIDLAKLAERLYQHHLGRERRIKVRDLAMLILAPDTRARHGSAPEVAVREALALLVVQHHLPVATEAGPDGGVWWLADEHERWAVVAHLEAQGRAIAERLGVLRTVPLAWRPLVPPQPELGL